MSGTRKVVINACYGGFSLSPKAVRRLAEMDGRPCYFFERDISGGALGRLMPITEEQAAEGLCWHAYDIPNPDEVLPSQEDWARMSMEERRATNAAWDAHTLGDRDIARDDPRLIQVIEELANQPSSVRILVLTSFADDREIFPAIRAGALGYLLKESGPHELLTAVRAVANGESSLHPSVARRTSRWIRRRTRNSSSSSQRRVSAERTCSSLINVSTVASTIRSWLSE